MAFFVLIHGSWHGGWCWELTQKALANLGHRSVAPSAPGCADQSHRLSASLTFADMVEDMVQRTCELPAPVVLVGHSSGAMLAAAVATRLPDKIEHLILLDGIVVHSGETLFDTYPAEERDRRIAAAAAQGGLAIPVPDPLPFQWGISDPQYAWARERLSAQPVATFTSAVQTPFENPGRLKTTYIECTAPRHAVLDRSKNIIRQYSPRWLSVPIAHGCMITAPDTVANLLAVSANP